MGIKAKTKYERSKKSRFILSQKIMKKYKYKRLFKDLEPFYPKRKDLDKLAEIMSGRINGFGNINEGFNLNVDISPKFAQPQLIHRNPPGYTYLLQFISHDITFDEASDRHRREDFPLEIIKKKSLKKLKNLRTPFLDLDSIYGSEIPRDINELRMSKLFLEKYDLPLLKLGETTFERAKPFPNDLPRGNKSVFAQIVDIRNDENLLLAQTQVAFMKFHNALVVELNKAGKFNYQELFEKARRLAIRFYQTMIIKDILPRIAQTDIIEELLEKVDNEEPNPYQFKIPLEFSVAVFRFGHSMIRNKYNVNKLNQSQNLDEMMKFTGRGGMGAGNKFSLPSSWIINWNRFYELEEKIEYEEMAMPIDTEISAQLLDLKPSISAFGERPNSIALLDLYRGRRFGLPSGQDIANKLGVLPLCPDQISRLIDSKKIKHFDPILSAEEEEKKAVEIKKRLKKVFSNKTPLWFYILAEAELIGNGKLGKVGSRIVVETLLNLIYYSDYSVLQEEWGTDEDILLNKYFKSFDMAEMLRFIQQACRNNFKELYPQKWYPNTETEFDELNPLEKGYRVT